MTMTIVFVHLGGWPEAKPPVPADTGRGAAEAELRAESAPGRGGPGAMYPSPAPRGSDSC